jgi:isoquinoline 1-oxidoreductase beta subunit
VIVDSAVPLGYWRSVGHSHNAFFKESFIDELAHAAGKDSVASGAACCSAIRAIWPCSMRPWRAPVRLPRARAWRGAAPVVWHHRGAGGRSGGRRGPDPRHKVVCAIDCGIAVNPNIIAQQAESAVLFGLSAALFGAITIKDGKVEQSNFHDYPVLRMPRRRRWKRIILPSAEHPEGMGEPATPPIAPAVANAVFKLTGKRLRSLPLTL